MTSTGRDGETRQYRCDDPNCYVSRVGRNWRDARFIKVDSPRLGDGMIAAGVRHFCSPRCLAGFAHNCDPPKGSVVVERPPAAVIAPAADASLEDPTPAPPAEMRPVRTAAEVWDGMRRSSIDS